jgi:hypothetical protein
MIHPAFALLLSRSIVDKGDASENFFYTRNRKHQRNAEHYKVIHTLSNISSVDIVKSKR